MAKQNARQTGTPPTWHKAEIEESTTDLAWLDEVIFPYLQQLAGSGHNAAARALQREVIAVFGRLRKKLAVPEPQPPTKPPQE